MVQFFRPTRDETIGVPFRANPLADALGATFRADSQQARQELQAAQERELFGSKVESLRNIVSARNPMFALLPREQQDGLLSNIVRSGPDFVRSTLRLEDSDIGSLSPVGGGALPIPSNNTERGIGSILSNAFSDFSIGEAVSDAAESIGDVFTRSDPAPRLSSPDRDTGPFPPSPPLRAQDINSGAIRSTTGFTPAERPVAGSVEEPSSTPSPRDQILDRSFNRAINKNLDKALGRDLKSLIRVARERGLDINISPRAIRDTARQLKISQKEVIRRLIRKAKKQGLI